MRAIKERLRLSDLRDQFVVEQEWAVRVTDLHGHLLRHRPHVVHFSGHGSRTGEIALEDQAGNTKPVSPSALKRTLRHPQGQHPVRGAERLLLAKFKPTASSSRSTA